MAPLIASSWPATPWIRAYGLAVVLVATALALGLIAETQGVNNLGFPLFMIAVAATVWYAGAGPGAAAIVLSILCFDYFITIPRGSFYIEAADRPLFVIFVLFTLMIGWFASTRRRIERDLRLARDKLEVQVAVQTEQASLLELTHDTIFVRDMNDVITYWNRGAEELYGWTPGQAVGKSAQQLLKAVFPIPADEIRAELLRAGRWEGELRKSKSDGTQVVVASRWSLRRNESGEPLAILETNNDVSDRKRDEQRIQALNADLKQRTIELEASNKELEAFAYSTSHDLRAPLRHLAGYTELLQKHASSVLDEKSRRYVTMLQESAKRMGELIDDLLTFSRIGRAETQNTLVSLGQLVREILSEFERETDGRSVVWRIGDLPSLHGDRAMLRLALINLISNAVKFTRSRPQAEIEIGCAKDGPGEVVVFVRDNGVGFDMKYVSKLFGVFQRLHSPEAFEGTGIGLATVQRIAARHGGRVWAEGSVDGGATFFFAAPKP